MGMPQPNGLPPASVSLGEVQAEKWEVRLSAVGSVSAVQGVTVAAEAEGVVREIRFEAGARVTAGEVLVRLDTDVEEAQLRAAEASADWARVSHKRAQDLIASRTISQAELDSTDAGVKQAEAQADNIRALIAKKTIVALFTGRLGIRAISVGQFLNKGEAIVSLQALDPVYVEFSLPQQRLGVVQPGLLVRVTSDAYAGRVFEGKVTAINADVDPVTRNVRVQATLANGGGELRPGMFVSVDVVLPESEAVLVVPATAIVYASYGNSIFLAVEGEAGPDGVKPLLAEQRTVRLGMRRGDFVAVTAGVNAGEKIVTNGAFKLRTGTPLIPSSQGVTAPELNPKPADM
jgi:membrane fusion protein (multidrug efflux system)